METGYSEEWAALTPEEKRRSLYDRQVATLKTFLEHGAITQAQHDKSLHDLTMKMDYGKEYPFAQLHRIKSYQHSIKGISYERISEHYTGKPRTGDP